MYAEKHTLHPVFILTSRVKFPVAFDEDKIIICQDTQLLAAGLFIFEIFMPANNEKLENAQKLYKKSKRAHKLINLFINITILQL